MVLAWWSASQTQGTCSGLREQHVPSLRQGSPGTWAHLKDLECQAEEQRGAEGEDDGATAGFVEGEAGSALGEGENRSVCASPSWRGILPHMGLAWIGRGRGMTGCSKEGTVVQRLGQCPASRRGGRGSWV